MFNSNTTTRNFNARIELSNDQLHAAAPSIFATAPVAGVSERYTFLPTAQIIARMRDEGWAPVEARQQAVRVQGRMGFQKHLIRFQRRDQIARVGEFAPELCLVNSHDRSSAYQLHGALWRFVCSNGLMVSDSTIKQVSIRHSGRETDEVLTASFAMFAQVQNLASRVDAWQMRHMSDDDRHEFARRAIALRWETNAPISTDRVLIYRRDQDSGNDLWSVYNAVQENLVRGGQKDFTMRREDGRRFARTRPIMGLDEGIRLAYRDFLER